MKLKIFLILISISFLSFAQIENISSDHPVYNFLKKLSVKGIINDYDDVVLPLSRSAVAEFLNAASGNEALTPSERALLNKYSEKFSPDQQIVSLVDNKFRGIFSRREKKLYLYSDSLITVTINPVFDLKGMYSTENSNSSIQTNFGGRLFGSYNNWFGFSVLASNAYVSGSRLLALRDSRIEQSFTFNETGLNFRDHTEGHLSLRHGIINLQLGRERILWGSGYINRMNLSGSSPNFDFIRFGLAYKAIKYDFIHGWLVQPALTAYIDSLTGNIRTREPKYIALNRIGLDIFDNFNAGISQAVIYAERPVEAAYLNPFLFWESAQRSLGDLDNSFLSIDMRWRLVKGLEWSFTFLFDDVHFGRLFSDGWNVVDNKTALQTGLYYMPSFLPDLGIMFEYNQVRPFTFSHAGRNEALTYTNNSYFLGLPVHPNSVNYSLGMDYLLDENFTMNLNFSHTDHGSNQYSPEGHIIRNYGGNIFENLTLYEPSKAYLLGGIPEKEYNINASVQWEFIRNYFIKLSYNYNNVNSVYRKSEIPFISAAFLIQYE
jgi:hypothetical protein